MWLAMGRMMLKGFKCILFVGNETFTYAINKTIPILDYFRETVSTSQSLTDINAQFVKADSGSNSLSLDKLF